MTTDSTSSPSSPTPELVLVVDSDVLSRMAIGEYLRDCGYRVIEAASVDEAMTILKQAEHKVEIVLADVASEDSTGGFNLARWVREHCPGVSVLMAGSVSRAAHLAGEICEEGPNLAKPYDPQVLVDRIKRLQAARAERL